MGLLSAPPELEPSIDAVFVAPPDYERQQLKVATGMGVVHSVL